MQDSEQLAQIAYEAYRRASACRSCVPPWNDLSSFNKVLWHHAAQAVKANVLSNFTKVGEGEQP